MSTFYVPLMQKRLVNLEGWQRICSHFDLQCQWFTFSKFSLLAMWISASFFFFSFFFFSHPAAYGFLVQKSDHSLSCNLGPAAAMPDPLTHWGRLGIEPAAPQRPELLLGFLTHCRTAGTLPLALFFLITPVHYWLPTESFLYFSYFVSELSSITCLCL